MRRGPLLAAAFAAASALAVSTVGTGSLRTPTAAAAASGTIVVGTSQVEATFANPVAGAKPGDVVPDRSIVDQLIRLIRGVPAGKAMHVQVFSLTLPGVKDALVTAARDHHAQVYVTHNGDDDGSLDGLTRAGGHVTWCGRGKQGDACLTGDRTGLAHAKFATFEETTDAAGAVKPWVSWFGSANETRRTGLDAFNNTVTVYGDKQLYDGFLGVWRDMAGSSKPWGSDYYDPARKRGYFSSPASRTTVYVSPERDSDIVAKRLSYVVPGPDCEVRLMQNSIHASRPAVLAQLRRLDGKDCRIYAVAADVDHGARCSLHRSHVTTHRDKLGLPRQVTVHDKTILVKARYNKSTDVRYLVFTGSHNLTKSALVHNDELFVKIESKELYDAFDAHFGAAWGTTETYPVPSNC